MLTGLKFILEDDDNDNLTVYADDDTPNFDNEEDFLDNAVAFMSQVVTSATTSAVEMMVL